MEKQQLPQKEPLNEPHHGLIYHSLHGRDVRGCLPVFILLALGIIILLFAFIKVEKPKDATSLGRGQVYYETRSQRHHYFTDKSPLPLELPAFADPARQSISHTNLPIARYSTLQQLSPIRTHGQRQSSMLLDAEKLLSLPQSIEAQAPWAEKAVTPPAKSPTPATP